MISEIAAQLLIYVGLPLAWAACGWSFILKENRFASLSLALTASAFAVVFLNNDFSSPFLSAEQTRLYTRLPLLAMTVIIAVDWLRGYRGRFGSRGRRP